VIEAAVRAQKADKVEPTMAGLRRILGDSVLDIFPVELRNAVDAAYKHWSDHPDSYLETPFDTADECNDALTLMRAYCECAPAGPWTLRTIDPDIRPVLHWRVQNRRGSAGRA